MSPAILILSMSLFFSLNSAAPVRHFVSVPVSRFPRAVFLREFCEGSLVELEECWASFRNHGGVWAADVDGDHVDELIVEPAGGWAGSAGAWYFLYRKKGNDWISMEREAKDAKNKDDEVGWQTKRPRFDVLPTVRDRHHDLRVEVDGCLKWDGAKYVWYEPEDYHRLSPTWFNASDNREAEIFWAIRYAGEDTMKFEPQWFPLAKDDFLTLGAPQSGSHAVYPPRIVAETLDDPQEHVRWIGILKGGVWGIRGNRVFFLAPQLSETFEGILGLKLEGDWLLAYGQTVVDAEKSTTAPEDQIRPSIRYNRRTHELQIERHDYNWEAPDQLCKALLSAVSPTNSPPTRGRVRAAPLPLSGPRDFPAPRSR